MNSFPAYSSRDSIELKFAAYVIVAELVPPSRILIYNCSYSLEAKEWVLQLRNSQIQPLQKTSFIIVVLSCMGAGVHVP